MTSPELETTHETPRELWLGKLTEFLRESGQRWAAGAEKQKDPVTGEKTLVHESEDGLWRFEDTYSGYFAAPGETKVFYKGKHAWSMQYGGRGQEPVHYNKVQETFEFLKEALVANNSESPIRGPVNYPDYEKGMRYYFELDGSVENGSWREFIDLINEKDEVFDVLFSQEGTCGVIIDKDADYNPVYPWDL